jgi:hypothetical protein
MPIFDRLIEKIQIFSRKLKFLRLSVRFTHETLCFLIVWVSFEVSYMEFLCYIMRPYKNIMISRDNLLLCDEIVNVFLLFILEILVSNYF